MFEQIRGFFMNILNYFHTYKIEELPGIETNITAEMYRKITLWAGMMSGHAPWNAEAKPCGILPQIAGRLNYFVTREIGLDVKNEAIKKPMEHLNKNIDKIVEYIVLMGGGLLRPIYAQNKLQYEIIPLGNYLPTQYDFDGTLTGAIVLKQIVTPKKNYLLCESHNYDGLKHNVELKLYENESGILRQVPLTSCKQTAELTPKYSWIKCGRPMIVEFRSHQINKIDGSNIPVALIDDAIDLIEKADKQFARMDWEQEAGEKRIFADRDMFAKRISRNGEIETVVMSKTLNKLVQKIDGDGSGNGEKIHEYSPELRTTAQNEYLQQIFRRIELTLNVGKGTVSDAESVQQTATQYSGGRQELFAIVDKIEDEIAAKYEDTALVFAYMAAAYGVQGAPRGNARPEELYTIKWNDDQTRKDIQQAKQTALQEISAGVLNKWEYRRDFYGEDEATAKANVPPEPELAAPFGLA
jgi:A118 family predicted phage portal protein